MSGDSEKDYQMKDYLVAGSPRGGFPAEFIYNPMLPILNQAGVGSCVPHALAKLKTFQELKERGYPQEWSRNFIYHNRHGSDSVGEGMVVRYALDKLRMDGVCEYKYFEGNNHYGNGEFRRKITSLMRDNAKYQRIDSYARVSVNNPNEIKRCLIENGVMLAALPCYTVFDMFYPNLWTGLNMPKDYVKFDKAEKWSGFHAVVVLGYRDTPNGLELKIQNSWGDTWGDHGVAWLSYDYPINELWTIVDEFLPPPTVRREVKFTINSNKYYVNNQEYTMDTVPVVVNERTLIPARFLATALSCSIDYIKNGGANGSDIVRIRGTENNHWVDFYVDSTKYFMTKTGQSYNGDAKVYVDKNYRTMIPLRALSEALGFDVKWNQSTQEITITKTFEVK